MCVETTVRFGSLTLFVSNLVRSNIWHRVGGCAPAKHSWAEYSAACCQMNLHNRYQGACRTLFQQCFLQYNFVFQPGHSVHNDNQCSATSSERERSGQRTRNQHNWICLSFECHRRRGYPPHSWHHDRIIYVPWQHKLTKLPVTYRLVL